MSCILKERGDCLNYFKYSFDIGTLYISEDQGTIVSISPDSYFGKEKESEIIKFCANEIKAYLNGELKDFTFEHKQEGTDFQKDVWNALQKIPYGIKVTYKEIAKMIENPKAAQAVGNACKRNQLLLVVPCHRIVAKSKSGGGFRMGNDVKDFLLKHEMDPYFKK